ncbi:MAG: hypothetical protein ACYCXP_02760 [Leptospirillum sp.]
MLRPALARAPLRTQFPDASFLGSIFCHVFDPEILDNKESPVRIYGHGLGGLVGHILPDIF